MPVVGQCRQIINDLVVGRLCALEGVIGVLTPGAAADVVVSDVNPLEQLALLAEPDAVAAVVARGRIVVDAT